MILLGVDPGLQFAGYGILKKENNKAQLLDYGCLKMQSSKSVSERVSIFHDFFQAKIQQFHITHLALETPFLGKNAQNFLKLGYLRGILYLLAHKHIMEIHEFAPTQVKQTLTGFGGASKDQVARVVLQLFPGMTAQEKADITDALAVTLCGFWATKTKLLAR